LRRTSSEARSSVAWAADGIDALADQGGLGVGFGRSAAQISAAQS